MGFKKVLEDGWARWKMDPRTLSRYVKDGLSGGEKKRLGMLQALVLQPTLSILDETESGLDIDARRMDILRAASGAPADATGQTDILGDVQPWIDWVDQHPLPAASK